MPYYLIAIPVRHLSEFSKINNFGVAYNHNVVQLAIKNNKENKLFGIRNRGLKL